MAKDDKTEKPTPKRRKDARKRGQIAKSPDISSWLVLLVGSLVVPSSFRSAQERLTGLMGLSTRSIADATPASAMSVLQTGLRDVLDIVLPLVGVFAAVGLVANLIQTGGLFSLHAAAPKWNRLNPATGVKNLLSTQTLWQLLKQVVKLLVLVGLAYSALSAIYHTLAGTQSVDLGTTVAFAGTSILRLVRDVSAVGLLLGIADWAWQKRKINQSLKMTKHEVKEENKQSEGNPHVKGEVRKKMIGMSRARMMAAIAGADVIVVNPTHYSVALRYDPSRGMAPVVVAKGADEVALRIREEAMKHKVPIVADPPLARAVYDACDLDDAIPPELFLAVARLLAFVFSLSPIVRSAGIVHRRPSSTLVA